MKDTKQNRIGDTVSLLEDDGKLSHHADDSFTLMIEAAGSSETSLHVTDDMKSHRRTRVSLILFTPCII